MSQVFIPEGYRSKLNLYETQDAIGHIKRNFEEYLARALNLKRVSAPLFVEPHSGLNDDLSGRERPVSFDIPDAGLEGVVVHSLAKWKRLALWRYNFYPGKGLYTDMNAIRRDEVLDNLHSIYVDQWDWEKVITPENRQMDYLETVVQAIVDSIVRTGQMLEVRYPQNIVRLERDVTFIRAQELEDLYPDLSPEAREDRFVREHRTVFISQIGSKMRSGQVHSKRAPDYDDWALNGDILFYNPVLDRAMEISSMGIRVDSESLDRQLTLSGNDQRRKLYFHKLLLSDQLPLTIGGGIGQSRLCMLLLGKAHIGEVQSSIWDPMTEEICRDHQVTLL